MVNIIAAGSPAHPTEAAASVEIAELPAGSVPARGSKRLKMGDMLPMVAVTLAVFSTMFSAVGLAAASRTVAEARIVMEELRSQGHAPDTDIAAAKAHAAPDATASRDEASVDPHAAPASHAAPTGAPLPAGSNADLAAIRDEVARLRADIARTQNLNGAAGIAGMVRDGQAELANRLNAVAAKVDRIDRSLAPRTAGAH